MKLSLAILLFGLFESLAFAGEWKQLPKLPDAEGFAGMYGGSHNGALIVAGGANFPGKKPWDGGKKTWYDTIYVLDKPDGPWKVASKLPRPLAYGVSVSHKTGVICIGGSDDKKHYSDVFRLEWKEGKIVTTTLSSLPDPLANACGAIAGDVIYVYGGQTGPTEQASSKGFALDLSDDNPTWKELDKSPGKGRILATAAIVENRFYFFGGASLDDKGQRTYLKDGYRYCPSSGWKQIDDLPYPIVAAPSPAPGNNDGFYVLGGDDGSQLTVKPDKHRGFSKTILRYDVAKDEWAKDGEVGVSRVTTPCIRWNDWWVIPSGEMKPGIRSPEVWRFTP